MPAGTEFVVRLGQAINSRDNAVGDTFPATLLTDLRAAGRTVIPAGRRFKGKIVGIKRSKKFKRLLKGDALKLTLISLEGASKSYPIRTNTCEIEGRGAKFIRKLLGTAKEGAIIGKKEDGTGGAVVGAGVASGTTLLLEGRRVAFEQGQRFHFELHSAIVVPVAQPTPSPQLIAEAQEAALTGSTVDDDGFWQGAALGGLVALVALLAGALIWALRRQGKGQPGDPVAAPEGALEASRPLPPLPPPPPEPPHQSVN